MIHLIKLRRKWFIEVIIYTVCFKNNMNYLVEIYCIKQKLLNLMNNKNVEISSVRTHTKFKIILQFD